VSTAPHVLINQKVFLYHDKAPFIPSGFSTMGALEYDVEQDAIRCHECGEFYSHLGAHVAQRHGLLAKEYKRSHGLKVKTPLIGCQLRTRISELGRKCAAQVTTAGRKSRFKKGVGSTVVKQGVQFEKRNERGTCSAQTLESIVRLARHLGRTPSIREMMDTGINITSTEDLFSMRMREIIEGLGLKPNGSGKKVKFNDERMEWPEDYFDVRMDDLKRRSSLA